MEIEKFTVEMLPEIYEAFGRMDILQCMTEEEQQDLVARANAYLAEKRSKSSSEGTNR